MAAPPTTTQKLLAEALGTAFLVFVGAGSAAATGVIASGTKVAFSMAQLGMISFAFMLVIVGAVYAIGHISGGHINPAVTLALAVSGKFGWREVPGYVAAQLVGATAGAAAIFLTLGKAATVAAGGGVTSYNSASMGFGRATLIEAIGTFMLVFVIFGVIDHRAVPGWAPMAIGSVVFAIIIIVGPATGAAINPARYLGTVFMQAGFGGTVSWAQVPAYLIGEIVGGSQREERLELLDGRLSERGIDKEHYAWYRDLRRYGTVPHAGFGLGFERTLAYVTGLANVRDAIPFPRTPGNAKY